MMLTNIVLVVFWIWGIRCLFAENMVLEGLGYYLRDKLSLLITKPLFDCPPCMSSVHGTIGYLYLFPDPNVVQWVAFCIFVCGVNYILKLLLFE